MGKDDKDKDTDKEEEKSDAENSTKDYSDEDDVPLSKLIPQVKAEQERRASIDSNTSSSKTSSRRSKRDKQQNEEEGGGGEEEDDDADLLEKREEEEVEKKEKSTDDDVDNNASAVETSDDKQAEAEQLKEDKLDDDENRLEDEKTGDENRKTDNDTKEVKIESTNESSDKEQKDTSVSTKDPETEKVASNNATITNDSTKSGSNVLVERTLEMKDVEITDDKNEDHVEEQEKNPVDTVEKSEKEKAKDATFEKDKIEMVQVNDPDSMEIDQVGEVKEEPVTQKVEDIESMDIEHMGSTDEGQTGKTSSTLKQHKDAESGVTSEFKMEVEVDEDDAFEDFRCKSSTKQKKKKAIKIKIAGMVSGSAIPLTTPALSNYEFDPAKRVDGIPEISTQNSLDLVFPFDSLEAEEELENSLRFFEQPHEDQDPVYTKFKTEERRSQIALALKNLKIEEEAGKKEIEEVVNQQLKEKQVATEHSVKKFKLKLSAEEKKDMARLQQIYDEKSKSNQSKIEQGMLVLRKRHAQENQKLLQQHRQNIQHRQVPEQVANSEWAQVSQRLRAKHQRQMAEFAGKGEEVKKKCEVEFKRDQTKLRKQYEKRLQDVDANRQSLYSRMYAGFKQLRERYLKRHIMAIAKRREALLKENAMQTDKKPEESPHEKPPALSKSKSDTEDKAHRPPSPLKTSADWYKESPHEPSGAAARHKHRKGVLSQINKQLSVEIHNEGIWISQIKPEEADKNKKKDSTDTSSTETNNNHFIPWGVKAREVLESIICGEIPQVCSTAKFDFGESVAQNGGHLRCVMTDLRTSNETASAQRAAAVLEREEKGIQKMEAKVLELQTSIGNTEKSVDHISKQAKELELKLKETLKDMEKTKLHLQAFRQKFSRYFGQGKKDYIIVRKVIFYWNQS